MDEEQLFALRWLEILLGMIAVAFVALLIALVLVASFGGAVGGC